MMGEMTYQYDRNILREIGRRIWSWGRDNIRAFPWRNTNDPYKILLAEIMLHRTRSSQVAENYIEFVRKYPDFRSVCMAGEETIVEEMASLGLKWRAVLFHRLSCLVYGKYGNHLPENREELLNLPGVGDYIASTVLCFIHGRTEPPVDTNTVRIAGRLLGLTITDSSRRNRTFKDVIGCIMDGYPCRTMAYALVDFGAIICTAKNPKCDRCPLMDLCVYGSKRVINDEG